MFHSQYRQHVNQFRAELDNIIATPKKSSRRLMIDPTGDFSRALPSKSMEQKMVAYGAQRFETVARVMSIFAILRDSEKLHQGKKITTAPAAAVWQAFPGTKENNACHTCPTHIQLDGMLPTLKTKNVGLQRHIIIEFADCILMPRSINDIDKLFDETAGKYAFLDAASLVLNERGTTWRDGVKVFRDEVRDFLGPARDIVLDTAGTSYVAQDQEQQRRLDMVSSYYQGIYLTQLNPNSIESLVMCVEREMGLEKNTSAAM